MHFKEVKDVTHISMSSLESPQEEISFCHFHSKKQEKFPKELRKEVVLGGKAVSFCLVDIMNLLARGPFSDCFVQLGANVWPSCGKCANQCGICFQT